MDGSTQNWWESDPIAGATPISQSQSNQLAPQASSTASTQDKWWENDPIAPAPEIQAPQQSSPKSVERTLPDRLAHSAEVAGVGAAKGIIGMTPAGLATNAPSFGFNVGASTLGLPLAYGINKAMGNPTPWESAKQTTSEAMQDFSKMVPTTNSMIDKIGGKYIPQPENKPEEFLNTAAQFAGGGGYMANAGNKIPAAIGSALSGVASEGAGQLTKGGPFEVPARLAAALATSKLVQPTSNQEAINALQENEVPVSLGQVRGGIPGKIDTALSSVPFAGIPLKNMAEEQNQAVANVLDKAGGNITDQEAGIHIQNTAGKAIDAIRATRNEIYKPYMDQIGEPVTYGTGKPDIDALGEQKMIYPPLKPTKSLKMAQAFADKFPNNPQAQKNAELPQIQDVVDLLKSPLDINQAKQQIGYLRDQAMTAQMTNRQLGASLTRISNALKDDISNSAEDAKPGAAALLREADAKAAPTYEEEASLKPIMSVPKDEAAADRFIAATGARKSVANSQMVGTLYKYASAEDTNKISAYLSRKLGQSNKPEQIGQLPDASLSGSLLSVIKAKNPDLYNTLFPSEEEVKQFSSAKTPINREFVQGLTELSKTPLNIPHSNTVKTLEALGGGGLGVHAFEQGIDPHTLAMTALTLAGTNAAAKLSAWQPIVKAYNQMPRDSQQLFLQQLKLQTLQPNQQTGQKQ